MKKVIFCNITYMNHYVGISDDDKPKYGGSWVAENEDAHEKFNFLDYNGRCYGYCPFKANQINLDRIVGAAYKEEKIDDVLVIWTAKKDELGTRVIVGWYEHATVYRRWQEINTYGFHLQQDFFPYYFTDAAAKDCYLLPEDKRTFIVPNASKEGTGHGMGQSPVWYADSEFARKEFVPKVLEYIMKYSLSDDENKFINIVFTKEYLEDYYHDENGKKTEKELEELANDLDGDRLYYLNALLNIKKTPELLLYKAQIFMYGYFQFDQAQLILEKLITDDPENTIINQELFSIYCITKQYEKAVITGQFIERSSAYQSMNIESKYCLLTDIAWQLVALKNLSVAAQYSKKIRALKLDNTEEDIQYLDDQIENASLEK